VSQAKLRDPEKELEALKAEYCQEGAQIEAAREEEVTGWTAKAGQRGDIPESVSRQMKDALETLKHGIARYDSTLKVQLTD